MEQVRVLPETAVGSQIAVRFAECEAYEIAVRGHQIVVDQPVDDGGGDQGATPTELFVASLAACVAYYAGRFLTRHGYGRQGLTVAAGFEMASGRPARVAAINLTVHVPPEVPAERWPALRAVVHHCTVHNTLNQPPEVDITLTAA
jgi:putative redox protein